MSNCGHTRLYARDMFNQPQELGTCLYCTRDALSAENAALKARLAEANAAFEAEQTEKWKLAGALAETEDALRQIAKFGIRNSGCGYSCARMAEHALRTLSQPDAAPAAEIVRLRKLVQKGREVVEDFLPNIGRCALQRYDRLNEFMVEAAALRAADNSTPVPTE